MTNHALTPRQGTRSQEDYIQKSWRLIKLHGSTNWYRSIIAATTLAPNDQHYFKFLASSAYPLRVQKRYSYGRKKLFQCSFYARYACLSRNNSASGY